MKVNAETLAALADGHAYVSLGQGPFFPGVLSVALLIDAMKRNEQAAFGFDEAGTQAVTATGANMRAGLPRVSVNLLALAPKGNGRWVREYPKTNLRALATPLADMQPIYQLIARPALSNAARQLDCSVVYCCWTVAELQNFRLDGSRYCH